ncbi:hypothetical protein KOR42_05770 [Thalassoglobus neptunius]|uniref:Uncharacterized protein n=1 Tax=Thalassoglobus neptunius TaxID=1938619 RepID=A0A5C5X3R3_9PLAN|nr:hypothetical protein [Thalassoglobus neptunius]TWT57219.1 hypothetical protein KOR42_05770 [Thalassoglobus neptunius]
MTVDHWEALFDSTYLRWFDIEGKGDIKVEIGSVSREELTLRGGAKKVAPVLKFKRAKKPLVLNKTNCDSVAKACGNKPSQWPGKSITLYVTTTKLSGKTVNCIRVRDK